MWISCFNQLAFSGTIPSLYFLFPHNSGMYIVGIFIIYQSVDIISCGVALRIHLMSVLIHASDKIICDPNVNCCICNVGKDIDVVIHFTFSENIAAVRRGGLPHQPAGWFAMTDCLSLLHITQRLLNTGRGCRHRDRRAWVPYSRQECGLPLWGFPW